MPVDRKKKDTTANAADSTQKQPTPTLPTQQEFRQYLRELARSAIRVVLESVMREGLDALIGVGWGESSRQQQGLSQRLLHPRAFSQRQAALGSCRCPEIARGSSTQVFERYRRYEPQVAQGLSEMFVAGTSTHKVGEVAETLMGVAKSASAISRLNRDLEQQFRAWRERGLQKHWRSCTWMAFISVCVMETKLMRL